MLTLEEREVSLKCVSLRVLGMGDALRESRVARLFCALTELVCVCVNMLLACVHTIVSARLCGAGGEPEDIMLPD
jgi:hypothetical protein